MNSIGIARVFLHYTQVVLLTYFQNVSQENKNKNQTSGLLNSSLWTRHHRHLEVVGNRLPLLDKRQVRELQIYSPHPIFTVQKDFALLKQLEWGICFG